MTDTQEIRLAQAWDKDTAEMVDVLSVTDGRWVVRGQHTGREHTRTFAELSEVWPASETLFTVDELSRAGWGVEHIYWMLRTLTQNDDWAQLLLKVWAENY